MFDVGTAVVDITPSTPQFLGGYDRMEVPTAQAHDPLQVRAFFVGRGRDAVVFTIVDTQGWFAGYQEGPYGVTDARRKAANWLAGRGYSVNPGHLIVSSTHSHSAPTIMGIWGKTDPAYLRQVHDATIEAIKQASAHTHKAELWTATGSIDALLAQNLEGTDHFDGWGVDDKTPVLWAREPGTGATLGLYANVPVHADQFRGSKYRLASADYPGAVRAALDRDLGGTAVIAMGTLGRQEAMGGINDYSEVDRQGRFITNAIERALARARPLEGTRVAGAEQYVAVPAHNPALLALLYANVAGFACYDQLDACTIDRSIVPFYLAGNVIGTWVTTVRIGDEVWSTEPGEAFTEVSTAIRSAIRGAHAVHVVGMAQDQLGYFYPPEDYPASELNPSDFILFNVSPTLADETVDAAALNAYRIGLVGIPQHPLPDDRNPHAFFEPGVQFWPGVVESAARDVEFLVGGKPSLSPVLLMGEHTVSPVSVDFGDGAHATVTGEQRITHTFAGPGSYDVTATAHDEKGQVRTWTRRVIVDPPPVAIVDQTPAGGSVALTAGVQGGDGNAIAAHWEFSDGTRADGLRVSHAAAAGVTATVTVVDGAGDGASTTVSL
ncbi:MAG: hypothetical protein QOI98_1288 [Solirubrobacteraceae bacterium]|nr:hypothetical protein [Solirubrobacteraceae bacterium]